MVKASPKPIAAPPLSAATVSPFDSTIKRPRKRLRVKRAKKTKLAKGKSTGGRPPFKPTDVDIGVARALAGVGYSQDDLAIHFGVCAHTIVKHFGPFIQRGEGELLARSYGAVSRALNTDVPIAIARSTGLHVLGTKGKRFGWSQRFEMTGDGGRDIFAGLDLTRLSDQKLHLLQDILTLAGAAL